MARDETNDMLELGLRSLESLGDVPSLMCGDVNQELADLPVQIQLELGGWKDLGDGPTCIGSNTTVSRRIDLMLANQPFQQRTGGAWSSFSTGLYQHAFQWCVLEDRCRQQVPRWVKPRPFVAPAKDATSRELVMAGLAGQVGAVRRSLAGGDLDGAWRGFEELTARVGACTQEWP